MELKQCLKPSEFVSIRIGNRTFSGPNSTYRNDAKCNSNRRQYQEFRFDTSRNPMSSSGDYTVTLTLAGGTSTSNPAPSPTPVTYACVTSLGAVSGTTSTTSKWASSCKSTNRTGSYAKFYSFTLAQMADVQIDLIAARSYDPYLYLLEGSGTTGTKIASDDDGGPLNKDSRVTVRLLPGTYTIEATTYRSRVVGDFRFSMTVTPMAAKRVKSTTVRFGQSLTQPKGLAWDGSQLYMVDDGTDALYTVATSTGVATRVSATTTRFGLSVRSVSPRGLAWDGSTLYMTTTSNLYKLNTETGVATLVGSYGTDVTGATGLAWKRSLTATSTGVAGKPAAGRLYMASSIPGKLYVVDETSGTVIDLGPFGIEKPTDMAWDGSRLYVLDEDTYALYKVPAIGLPEPPSSNSDVQTKQIGSAVRFGITDVTLDDPRGLTMVGKDLYMVEDSTNTDFLYTVNRETGVAGKVGSAGLSRSAIQSRCIAWDGTTIYMATPNSLYKINRAYGTAIRVGAFGAGITDAFGLAWDGEKLYMVDRRTDALYTVATSTGVASRVNSYAYRFGAYVSNPSSLVWVGPPASEVEDDNDLPSLYMGSAEGKLYKVNKDTGRATYVARLGKGDVTGLAWFDDTSTLYFVGDTSDALHAVTGLHRFLPNEGDLYYNGSNFADGFVRWDSPSWVLSSQCQTDPLKCSTYEHDLKLEWQSSGGWFSVSRLFILRNRNAARIFNSKPFCTAWSDLPVGYDDCVTAGVGRNLEPGIVELSFGTYKAPQIEGGRDYYGFWIFKNQRGSGSTTNVRLYGQEGRPGAGSDINTRCDEDDVQAEDLWCVEGVQEGSILESGTTWSYGTPSYTTYSRP